MQPESPTSEHQKAFCLHTITPSNSKGNWDVRGAEEHSAVPGKRLSNTQNPRQATSSTCQPVVAADMYYSCRGDAKK